MTAAKPVISTKPTLGIGIVGSGLMAKAHTMAWRNLQAVYGEIPFDIKLVILADATEDLARAGAEQFGYAEYTDSWEDVVNHPEVDLVDIVTPNWLHRDIAIAAAQNGKHVWCEKPLALTATDAAKMAEAAEAADVVTLVGFSYLRNPAVVHAQRLIEAGEIGTPVSFTGVFAIDAMTDPDTPITWRQRREEAGSGALGDLGAHVIAMARALVGEFDSVAALNKITVADRPEPAGNFGYGERAADDAPRQAVENDDVTMVLAAFDSGAIGTLEASRVSAGRAYDLGFTVTGTKGAIRFDQQHMYELQVRLASDPEGSTGFRHLPVGPAHGDFGVLWPVDGINISIHDLKFFEAYDLVMAIHEDRKAWPDFRDGQRVCEVMDAIEQAAAEGQTVALSAAGEDAK
ncbi:Gfo/Idh/MocA family protein [Gulosibacter chungangensis]|uniref:Gfo/Idh/MocA family oxidoreductase n=1 Tax=Gulosibacter chungangensis TaxID=979746 RepID=A0A7J5BFR3_9MICO|nr:Gfo/Idh/MocA family oxidoreductase [Gulosibacter chungangensis]KAB1644938.1 Gfo/Idh/MocA family oxidoreductase [Gulosibacter chungangensis]